MLIVHLGGHLGKDPETRFTPSGQKVTTFSVATNQRKGKEDVTIWVRVTLWGDRFDKMLSFLKKGSGVIVTGRMTSPSAYKDKEERIQVSLEVTAEMIEFSPFGKGDRQGEAQSQQASHPGTQTAYESHASSQYNEGQFQASQTPQYNKHSQYSGQTSGQGSHYSEPVDDDALPF